MQLLARTLRYLANGYLSDLHRSNLDTARANAAEAYIRLRERRREQADVDAYLRARLGTFHAVDRVETSQDGGVVEHAQ